MVPAHCQAIIVIIVIEEKRERRKEERGGIELNLGICYMVYVGDRTHRKYVSR